MTRAEAPQFIQMLTTLGELFGVKLSAGAQTMYFEALRDLTLDQLREAVASCARKSTFMPKPIELRENICAEGETSRLESEAAEAWTCAKQALSRYGAWMPKGTLRHEVVAPMVEIFGGWSTACNAELSGDAWSHKRREYIASYIRESRACEEFGRQDRLEELDAIDNANTLPPTDSQRLLDQ